MLWFLSLIECYYCHDIQSQTGATMGFLEVAKNKRRANVSENSSWDFEIPTGCGETSNIFQKKITPKTWGRDVCPFWLLAYIFQRVLKVQPPNELTAIICSCRSPAQPLRVLKWLVRAIHEWSSGELRVWFFRWFCGRRNFHIFFVSNWLLKQIYIYIIIVSGDYQRKFEIEVGWDIEYDRLYGSKWSFFL